MRRTAKTIILAAGTFCVAGCAESDMQIAARRQQNLIPVQDAAFETVRDAKTPKILPETHFAAAQLFESRGQVNDAIQQYRRAIAVNHAYVEAYHRLGLLLSMTGQRDEAIAAFQRGVKLKPGNAMLRNNLGFEFLLAKRWKEARRELARAVKIKPGLARAQVNLGIVQSRLGRFDEALASFRNVLPEPDAYYNLGLMYRGQRRYEQAVEVFQYVLMLDPSFVAAQSQLDKIANSAPATTWNKPDAMLAASRTHRKTKQTPTPTGPDPCAERPGVTVPEPKPEPQTWEETLDRFDRIIDPDCDAPPSVETKPTQIGKAIQTETPERIEKSKPSCGVAEMANAPALAKSPAPVMDLDAYIEILDRELSPVPAERGVDQAARETGITIAIEESAGEIMASEAMGMMRDEEVSSASDAIDAIPNWDLADATISKDKPVTMIPIDSWPTFSIAPDPINTVDLALIASTPDGSEVIEEDEPCDEELLVESAVASAYARELIDRTAPRRPIKTIVPTRPAIAAKNGEPGPACDTIPVSWIESSPRETIRAADVCPVDPPMSYVDIAPRRIAAIFSSTTISSVASGQTGDRLGSDVIEPIVSSTDSLALLEILEDRLAIVRNEVTCIEAGSTPQIQTLAEIDESQRELMGPPADLAPAPRKNAIPDRPARAQRKARLVSEEQIRSDHLDAPKGNPEAGIRSASPARAIDRPGVATPAHQIPGKNTVPPRRTKVRESRHKIGADSGVDAALKMILEKLKEEEKRKADPSPGDVNHTAAPEGAGASSNVNDQTRYRQLHGDHGHSTDPMPED